MTNRILESPEYKAAFIDYAMDHRKHFNAWPVDFVFHGPFDDRPELECGTEETWAAIQTIFPTTED